MSDLNAMSFDSLVPKQSKYLSKEDVGTGGLILTIAGFKREAVKGDDGDEDKIIMYFAEDVKPMIVNRTNAALLAGATGVSTAGDARGKQIIVYNDANITFGGKVTGGLRVRSVEQEKPRPAPARAAAAPPIDDDIPF